MNSFVLRFLEQAARKLYFLNYIIYLENIWLENFVFIVHIHIWRNCTSNVQFSVYFSLTCAFIPDTETFLDYWVLDHILLEYWFEHLHSDYEICPVSFQTKKIEIIELKTMSLKLWFFPKPTSFWLLYLYFPGRIVSLLFKIMLPMCFCPALVCSKICFKFFVHKWSVPFQIMTPSDHEFLVKVPFQWQLRLVKFCRAESS